MSDFGSTPLSTRSIGSNQFPVSSAFVPGTSGGALTSIEGTGVNVDGSGYQSTGIRVGLKDGDDTTQGLTTDVAVTGDTAGTVSGKLRGMVKILTDIWDSVNHRIKVDGSGVTQPVSGTFWQTTQPVSGTVTANAGTNLNTSLLALESGGNLATLVARTPVLGQATRANSIPVTLASDQPANAWTQVYSVTETGVSSWAGSGDITGMHAYSQLMINLNVSAMTGTSIQLNVKRKDSFGNYITVGSGVTLTSAQSQSIDVGPAMLVNHTFGDTIQLSMTFTGITSVSFTIDVEAR